MTRDRARKKAIRARMAATGEPYSAAARGLDAAAPADEPEAAADPAPAGHLLPADDPVSAAEVVARVNNTLAVSRARAEIQTDWDFTRGPGRRERRRPGPVGRLAGFAAKAVWDRFSPETDFASVREEFKQRFKHAVGEGFVEPAADRYQIDFGYYAMMQFNGQHYSGASGSRLQSRYRSEPNQDEPLVLLKRLRDVTDARSVGQDMVRGAPCRAIAVRAGTAELTVWIDDEHIRRVQTGLIGSSETMSASVTRTLELWDFGAEDGPDDWTHLPSFRTPERTPTPEQTPESDRA